MIIGVVLILGILYLPEGIGSILIKEKIMLLEVKNLNKNLVQLSAANNINFKMNENEIIGVIGANGAGKTTFVI